MKITIITVCYNSETTIRDTILSVLNQTYSDIEYIIIDGASQDGTLKIIEEYGHRITKVLSEPDKGIYDAMNKGLLLATGDFIGVLNSDDFFVDANVIQDLAEFLKKNPNLDGAYADLVYVKRNNTEIITRHYSSKIFSPGKIRFGIMCPHPTFYAKKKLFDDWGGFDTSFPVAADFELITRFICRGGRFARNNRVMVKMREGGVSTLGLPQRVQQNLELVAACKKNNIYTNIFFIGLKIPYKLAGLLRIPRNT